MSRSAALLILVATAACALPQSTRAISASSLDKTVPIDGGRTYRLHVPAEYVAGQSTKFPLVLSFHGANGLSSTQETLSQFSTPGLRIADLPVFAAYPQGVPNTTAGHSAVWQGAPYANTTVNDIQFTKDILKDISSSYSIDQTRIYATGKSNGGGFTNLLACTPSTASLFAAFGIASGALYPGTLAFKGCDPQRSGGVPIINSHGTVDATIPFDGRNDSSGAYGVGTATINIDLWRSQWAARNGDAANAVVSTPYANTTQYVWSASGKAEVRGFTVAGLGHSWPTTLGLDPSGAPDNKASFNLTAPQMVAFFSRYQLSG